MQALHKVLALSLASKLERTLLPNALGNGIIHSQTQNLRGLPLVNRDAGVMQDQGQEGRVKRRVNRRVKRRVKRVREGQGGSGRVKREGQEGQTLNLKARPDPLL